jgi:hypothetical protein
VTAIGSPVGLVQASCNPFKEERSLKGVNLGEIKDQVLEKFKPELEKINLPYSLIKKIAERKAKEGSVGFTPKDMEAIYGGTESYKTDEKNRTTVNGYDFLKANSGGHKCITNITGINFLYSGYDKPYTKDLPQETLPIANYEGKNNFVNDIRSKLLKFRKLSEKQIEMALNQIKKEGVGKEDIPVRTTNDLVKDIQNEFIKILNDKIQSQQSIQESKKTENKKYYIGKSKIHGNGVFASNDLKKGETIGLLHKIIKIGSDYDFTELGKTHNHKNEPNCHNKKIDNKRYLVASRNIKKGEELTTDYRLQPDLEQPKEWDKKIKEQDEKMLPEKDGYRTYSPFKDMDYIIVNGNGIDCDNIVYDLVLVGDNMDVKFCKKNSGSYYIEGAKKVVEIPLKNNENPYDIFKDKKTFYNWLSNTIKKIDNNGELKQFFS